MGASSRDVAISLVIAVAVIVIIISHKWRLSPNDIAGYWRPVAEGEYLDGEYEIVADPHSKNGVQVTGRDGAVPGVVKFLRRVCIDGDCGTVDLQGRHLEWGRGKRWVREGVFSCSSCLQ